uniref:DNA topoisomerase 2 n=1 Tax=Rhodosorus marinus TaxID=101924 RepID=A0A7S3EQK6_9RHOD|mmetsp:Transcript_872/g.2201  ORF Transcript_872/g.2201 Transcript_872/m.2201 type:complete len:1143 (+) Transcript_872:183-3611(+)
MLGLHRLRWGFSHDALRPFGSRGYASTAYRRNVSVDPSTMYRKLSPVEHVLMRPEVYLGTVQPVTRMMWFPKKLAGDWRVLPSEVKLVPAFAKIFDEIIVNAADNYQRDQSTSRIDVTVDPELNLIKISNDGRGPPVMVHRHEQVYIPEMIFGTLLTGSNFGDSLGERTTAGRHGYGAKLTNIMSTEFTVHTSDPNRRKTFSQSFYNNMRDRNSPVIEEGIGLQSSTTVEFRPDLVRFGMQSLDRDAVDFMRKRTWDIAACLADEGVQVTFNGERIPFTSFRDYAAMHGSEPVSDSSLVFGSGKRFQYGMRILREDERSPMVGVQQVSFVNSVATYRGGSHVQLVLEKVLKAAGAAPEDRVSNAIVRGNVLLFAKATLDKPSFESQSKEMLTTKLDEARDKLKMAARFIPDVTRQSGLVELLARAVENNSWKNLQATAKTNKKDRKHLLVPKLEDALKAGKGDPCTLIVTEGDSAKALAMAGLAVIGRDSYGVYPLRGKMLNVRDQTTKTVAKNEELTNIVRVLGLKYGADYSKPQERATLRYHKIMLMTDQDHDGHHIKALMMNFFHHFWPELLQSNTFFETFSTPIVKAIHPKLGVTPFYDLKTVEEYKKTLDPATLEGTTFKYYKGLGTSTREEGQEYFRDIDNHRSAFKWTEGTSDLIDMVFRRDRTQERKDWLYRENPEKKLSNNRIVDFADFLNNEVLEFSRANVIRSIPTIVDGMKPSQRKILFACMKKNLYQKEMKVAQLSGYVSETTAYHHGENSIQNTITKMAQGFVGANNLPLLLPSGQFGTRLQGGDDHASARYLFTKLSPLVRKIFVPEDDLILRHKEDDGQSVEPETFYPIVPMILVNGTQGIGSGFSTIVPGHDVVDIIDNILNILDGGRCQQLMPYGRGFTGTIRRDEETGDWISEGVMEIPAGARGRNQAKITELPLGTWTENYRSHLLDMETKGDVVKRFREKFTDSTVMFDVYFTKAGAEMLAGKRRNGKDIMAALNLRKKISSVYYLFDEQANIRRFNGAEHVLEDFVNVRMDKYAARKAASLARLREDLATLDTKRRFSELVNSGELRLFNQPVEQIAAELNRRKFKPIGANLLGYSYLLNTTFSQLTAEAIDVLSRKYNKVIGRGPAFPGGLCPRECMLG